MLKLLWVNPSFLDYRIPLYKKINDKMEGHFRLIYSRCRVPQRCADKIEKAIGQNAISLIREKIITIGRTNGFANCGVNIPITCGLYKLIKSTNPDIIIAEGFFQFTPLTLLYALFNHVPLMIAYERTKHTERNCPFYRRWYRRFINIFVSAYIVNGTETKEYLISQGVKTDVIFTGAMCADSDWLATQISHMSKEEINVIRKSILGTNNHGIVYIYVGRIIALKGIAQMLEAWKEHAPKYPNDILLLVGEGDQLNEFRMMFHSQQSVLFIGGIDYADIYKYYAISDVFIIPTLEDNWSLVVPEAMACGLPIACSIYNGCHPELVKKDENGITFDPLNRDSILHALAYFHNQDLIQMGNRSVAIEKEYNPEKTADNIINAIRTVCLKRKERLFQSHE